MTTYLSPHFSLEELTASQAAARLGLKNIPTGAILANLTRTADLMEKVREALGARTITVSSGYRSPRVNEAVGGSPTSAHVFGYAVDFNCHGFGTPLEVAKHLERTLNYDQLIHEYGSWVHISFDPKRRNMELTIDRKGTRSGLLPVR